MRKRFYKSRKERDLDWLDEIDRRIERRKSWFKAIRDENKRQHFKRKARGERLVHLLEPEPEWLKG